MASVVQNLSYTADGVTVPADFDREDFIRVFVEGEEVTDFTIEADGIGGRSLILKGESDAVCLVYDPDISFELNKIGGRDVVASLNGYFDRVRRKCELIECRLDGALGAGVCGPAGADLLDAAVSGFAADLESLSAKIPTFEDGQIWQMVGGSFVPISLDDEAATDDVDASPWDVKPARRNPFPEWECVEYCASYWPQEYCEFSWPVKWSDCEGERFTPPVWFKDMIPVNWIGYRKPDRDWQDGCILYPPRKNTILPAAWS